MTEGGAIAKDSANGWAARPGRSDRSAASDIDPLFTVDAMAAVRGHPLFRRTAESICATAMAVFEEYDPDVRWMVRDFGRVAIGIALAVLDLGPSGVTAGILAKTCVENGACSRARALAFVDHGLGVGLLDLTPGVQSWTKRRLIVRPAFRHIFRAPPIRVIGAALELAPDLAEAAPRLADDSKFALGILAIGYLAKNARRLGVPPNPIMEFFIARECGLLVLQHLAGQQASGRERLLQAARIVKFDVARRCGISRAHLDTLLADAEGAGLLSLAGRNRAIFDPALDEAFSQWAVLQIQGLRYMARAMAATV